MGKESMKEILESSSHSNQQENGAKKGTISFQTLCNKLKESNGLKSNTKHLLTIPNCFMSLMHLSTQIGLDLSRFHIEGLRMNDIGIDHSDNNNNINERKRHKKKRKHKRHRDKKKKKFKGKSINMNDKNLLGDFIVFTKCNI